MAKLVLCLSMMVASCFGQIKFPDEGKSSSSSNRGVVDQNRQSDIPINPDHNLGSSDEPQQRFLGLFSGLSCLSCSPQNPVSADRCCRRGEVRCCGFSGFGGGFGNPGFGNPGFGNPGFGQFPVGPGFTGHHAGGLQPVGPPGFIPNQGFGNSFGNNGLHGINQKFGFCPRPSLLGGFGNLLGLRNGLGNEQIAHGNVFADEGKSNIPHRRPTRQVQFGENDSTKSVNSPTGPSKVSNDQPSGRFLPFLSGLPNPFCRDQCFSDLDCPGFLKCCIDIRNCRACTPPSQQFF